MVIETLTKDQRWGYRQVGTKGKRYSICFGIACYELRQTVKKRLKLIRWCGTKVNCIGVFETPREGKTVIASDYKDLMGIGLKYEREIRR